MTVNYKLGVSEGGRGRGLFCENCN